MKNSRLVFSCIVRAALRRIVMKLNELVGGGDLDSGSGGRPAELCANLRQEALRRISIRKPVLRIAKIILETVFKISHTIMFGGRGAVNIR